MQEKAIQSLKSKIKQILNHCVINDGEFDIKLQSDTFRKLEFEINKQSDSCLNRLDTFAIFYRVIYSIVKEEEVLNTNSGKLADLLGEDKISELENALLKYILSLPRKYETIFYFPRITGLSFEEFELTPNAFIGFGKEDESHDENCSMPVLERLIHAQPIADCLYIKIVSSGYAYGTMQDTAIKNAFSTLEQLLVIGIAQDLFSLSFDSYFTQSNRPLVYHRDKEDPSNKGKVDAPVNINNLLSNTNISINRIRKNENLVHDNYEDVIDNIDKYIRKYLEPFSKIDSPKLSIENSDPIKTAIHWALESRLNINKTFSFVLTSIGLESILGESSDRELLTSTLSDRYAYLLGKNFKSRKILRKHFKEFYAIRSKLVHGRKVYLKDDENKYLMWGQEELNRLILKEISLI